MTDEYTTNISSASCGK